MEEIIEIPEGVTAKVEGELVTISGKLGELKRTFSDPSINLSLKENKIYLTSNLNSRKQKRMMNTFVAEIKNQFQGVLNGFTYTMKIVFTHFPMTVKTEGDKIRIDNFLGERAPRFAKAFPNVEINIKKQDVEIKGIDKYSVSQTAANLEQACRVGKRDRRIFQDGIYITKKDSKVL